MELIKAPLAVMVPEQIGLLKIEIEQMSVKYFAIKSSEIKVFISPDMEFVKKKINRKRVFANLRKHFTVYSNISTYIALELHRTCVNYSGGT